MLVEKLEDYILYFERSLQLSEKFEFWFIGKLNINKMWFVYEYKIKKDKLFKCN